MPEASPPPPHGMTMRAGRRASLGQLLEDLQPDRSLAGDDGRIVEARHHVAPLSAAMRAAISSRLSVRRS